MARARACSEGSSVETSQGVPRPETSVTRVRTVLGAIAFTCRTKSRAILLGSWSGARRMLTLAMAWQGRTVFAPSPMKPL